MNPNLQSLLMLLSNVPNDKFPSQIYNKDLGLDGQENSVAALSKLYNEIANGAVQSGDAPFSDGKDYAYDLVDAGSPATASAMAMLDANNKIGLPQSNIDAGKIAGNGEYSLEDFANMDDSELDLDMLELLKKNGLR